jgi:hypothetical protein
VSRGRYGNTGLPGNRTMFGGGGPYIREALHRV